MDAADGYYYKELSGVTVGPLDKEEFERRQIKGLLKPGMKAWRQKAGSYYMMQLSRRYTIGRLFSISSIGHTCEITMMMIALVMLVFIFRTPKLQEELHHSGPKHDGGEDYFLEILFFLTFALTIFSIKTNVARLSDSSCSVVSQESPV